MKLKFIKIAKKWYAALPEYNGDIQDLEMVLGADTVLDNLNKDEVTLLVNTNIPNNYDFCLKLNSFDDVGAWYFLDKSEIWLCAVVKFLFGDYPKNLYITND